MTGEEVRQARETLGREWGLGRPLSITDLALVMRTSERTIADIEAGRTPGSRFLFLALRMMLDGAHPPDLAKILRL